MSLRRNRDPFIINSPPMTLVGTPMSDDGEPQPEAVGQQATQDGAAEAADPQDHGHADRRALGSQVVRVRRSEDRSEHG